MIKTNFWIIGLPSGEALSISEEELDELYIYNLASYNSTYGFYFYEDNKRHEVTKVISTVRGGNEDIQENNFDDSLLKKILDFLENLQYKVSCHVKDNMMTLSFYDYILEIEKKQNYTDIYTFIKYHKRRVVKMEPVLGHRILYKKLVTELELL